jgi:hypothetical protein
MDRAGGVIAGLWLVIGLLAAYQRGNLVRSRVNCAELATVLVTMVVGPLDYLRVIPRIGCAVPRPSA